MNIVESERGSPGVLASLSVSLIMVAGLSISCTADAPVESEVKKYKVTIARVPVREIVPTESFLGKIEGIREGKVSAPVAGTVSIISPVGSPLSRGTPVIAIRRQGFSKTLKPYIVEAPFAGWVSSVLVSSGEEVQPGMPLAYIVDISAFRISLGVGEDVVMNISRRNPRVYIPGKNRWINAKLLSVGKSPDPRSGLYPVKVKIDGKENLLLGARAEVRLPLAPVRLPVIPHSAVIWRETGSAVFTLETNGSVSLRYIKFKSIQDGLLLITDGIKKGEEFVLEGKHQLFEGALVEVVRAKEF